MSTVGRQVQDAPAAGLDHHHEPAGESRWSAVLDIGGDVGALILYTRPELAGTEIEVSPVSAPDRRTHTEVLARRTGSGEVWAALYAALDAGEYRVWGASPGLPEQVTVTGGRVAELDWR